MAKASCKKCSDHECEECPDWIFTFADLVMLMMGFFVILWVLKPPPGKSDTPEANAEWIKVVAAIREAFDYLPDPQSKDPVDVQILLNKIQKMRPHVGPGDGGQTRLARRGAEGTDPEVTSIRPGKQAAVGGRLLFDAGDAALTVETRRALDQIAQRIRGHRNIVLVKGHTSPDDLPPSANAQQQMDLSLRRAQIVADYLTASGVAPDVLRVQGCSVFEPVTQREYDLSARQRNRRVEVEVTDTLVPQRQDDRPAR